MILPAGNRSYFGRIWAITIYFITRIIIIPVTRIAGGQLRFASQNFIRSSPCIPGTVSQRIQCTGRGRICRVERIRGTKIMAVRSIRAACSCGKALCGLCRKLCRCKAVSFMMFLFVLCTLFFLFYLIFFSNLLLIDFLLSFPEFFFLLFLPDSFCLFLSLLGHRLSFCNLCLCDLRRLHRQTVLRFLRQRIQRHTGSQHQNCHKHRRCFYQSSSHLYILTFLLFFYRLALSFQDSDAGLL